MQRIISESFNKEQFLRSIKISNDYSVCDWRTVTYGTLGTETEWYTLIGTETEWHTLRGTNVQWKTDLRINFEI